MLSANLFKIHLLTALISAWMLTGCGNKNKEPEKVPENLLSQDQLAEVLVDFALAESAFNLNVKSSPVNKLDSVYAFDPLKENKVSKSLYDSSLLFYAKHPSLYSKVYEAVLVKLTQLESSRDSVKAAAGPK